MNTEELQRVAREATAKREGLYRDLMEARRSGQARIEDARAALAAAETSYRATGDDKAWATVERATNALRRAEVDFDRTTKPLQEALTAAEATEIEASSAAAAAEIEDLVAGLEPLVSVENARAVIAAQVAEIAIAEAAAAAAERNAARRERVAALCRERGFPVPAAASRVARTPFEAKREALAEIADLRRASVIATLGGERIRHSSFLPASGDAFHAHLLDAASYDASERVLGDLYAFARQFAPTDIRKAALAKVRRVPREEGIVSGLINRALGAKAQSERGTL